LREEVERLRVQLARREQKVVMVRGLREHVKVICLCGSTRFTEVMLIKQWELTKQGHVVLSWCALPDSYLNGKERSHIGDQEGVKEVVDEVHLRKIDLCDEVLVINVGGYIGMSTQKEIEYATAIGRPVLYLEALTEGMQDEERQDYP
jgi:hypothetical protein